MTTNKITTAQSFTYPDPAQIKQTDIRKRVEARIADVDKLWAATPHTPGNEAETDRIIGLAIDLHNDLQWLLNGLPVKFSFIDPESLDYKGATNTAAARRAACRLAQHCEDLAASTRIAEAYTLADRLNHALHAVLEQDFGPLRDLKSEVLK